MINHRSLDREPSSGGLGKMSLKKMPPLDEDRNPIHRLIDSLRRIWSTVNQRVNNRIPVPGTNVTFPFILRFQRQPLDSSPGLHFLSSVPGGQDPKS